MQVWSDDIQLGLKLWQSVYQGIQQWLRCDNTSGDSILTSEEKAGQVELEKQRVRLAQQVRVLGVEPDGNSQAE